MWLISCDAKVTSNLKRDRSTLTPRLSPTTGMSVLHAQNRIKSKPAMDVFPSGFLSVSQFGSTSNYVRICFAQSFPLFFHRISFLKQTPTSDRSDFANAGCESKSDNRKTLSVQRIKSFPICSKPQVNFSPKYSCLARIWV